MSSLEKFVPASEQRSGLRSDLLTSDIVVVMPDEVVTAMQLHARYPDLLQ